MMQAIATIFIAERPSEWKEARRRARGAGGIARLVSRGKVVAQSIYGIDEEPPR